MIVVILLHLTLASVVAWLISFFGNWRTHAWYIQALCFIAWYFPFSIVLMLPIDLASTLHDNCLNSTLDYFDANSTTSLNTTLSPLASISGDGEARNSSLNLTASEWNMYDLCNDPPLAYVPRDALLVFWQTVYWTMQALTWFLVPVMISWSKSGEFRFGSRLWTALKENTIYYAILGVIGIIFLGYMIFAVKLTQLSETRFLQTYGFLH